MEGPESAQSILDKYLEIAEVLLAADEEVHPSLQCLLAQSCLLPPPLSSMRDMCYSLFIYLYQTFWTSQNPSALEEAICLCKHILPTPDNTEPNPLMDLSDATGIERYSALSVMLGERFQRLRHREDLESSISYLRKTISLRLESDKLLPHDELVLSRNLGLLFQLTEDYRTIAEAISFGRSALQKMAQDDPHRYVYENNLADVMLKRASLYGTTEDCFYCVGLLRSALESAHKADANTTEIGLLFHNAGASLLSIARYMEHPAETVDQSLQYLQLSFQLIPPGQRDHFARLGTLASAHTERFLIVGDLHDADEAIKLLESALGENSTISDHLRIEIIGSLGSALFQRFQKSNTIGDLDKAIAIGEDALKSFPHLRPAYMVTIKSNVALSRWHRFGVKSELHDSEEALKLFSEIAHAGSSVASTRFQCASFSALAFYTQRRYEEALKSFQNALEIVPQIILLGNQFYELDHETVKSVFTDVGLNGAACSIECGNPNLAIEILENGRSIAWAKKLQTRSDFDELKNDHPTYARRLGEVGNTMEKALTNQMVSDSGKQSMKMPYNLDVLPWEQTMSYSQQWEVLLAEIRTLDGYQTFLLPKKYEALRHVASNGPVVIINISSFRCDALIITMSTLDRPQIVPLASDLQTLTNNWSTQLAEGTEQVNGGLMSQPDFRRHVLRPILTGLWKEIVLPVRKVLCSLAPYARRIWWCPTGPLTFLPLHAATNGAESHAAADMPRLIPSYTTTLSSLLRAQSSPRPTIPPSLLAIGCGSAAGYRKLPGVDKELRILQNLLPEGFVSSIREAEATVPRVLAGLADNPWVHLSCHGEQTVEFPYRSRFVLGEHDNLHMYDIASQRLANSEFAFLSACHTARGVPRLHDEAMHLAAALHFAGFRGTIATAWAVDDDIAPRVVREVYSYLFRDPSRPPLVEEAAEALHYAIDTLRKKGVAQARLAPFIHIGV